MIAFVGDGAMQMNGINGADHDRASTGASGRTRGSSCCVLNNGDLNQVTWEQRVMAGDPEFEVSQDVPELPLRASSRATLGLARRRGSSARTRSRRAWDAGARAPTGRRSSTPTPTRTSRRCRRTSTASRPRSSCASMLKGDPHRWRVDQASRRSGSRELPAALSAAMMERQSRAERSGHPMRAARARAPPYGPDRRARSRTARWRGTARRWSSCAPRADGRTGVG